MTAPTMVRKTGQFFLRVSGAYDELSALVKIAGVVVSMATVFLLFAHKANAVLNMPAQLEAHAQQDSTMRDSSLVEQRITNFFLRRQDCYARTIHARWDEVCLGVPTR